MKRSRWSGSKEAVCRYRIAPVGRGVVMAAVEPGTEPTMLALTLAPLLEHAGALEHEIHEIARAVPRAREILGIVVDAPVDERAAEVLERGFERRADRRREQRARASLHVF